MVGLDALALMRLLSWRLAPKAAAAPKMGRGPGAAGVGWDSLIDGGLSAEDGSTINSDERAS